MPWLYDIFSEISRKSAFKSAFDRFGGTASVSLLLQNMNKKVIYHDALNFNTLSARALLSSKMNGLRAEDMNRFVNGVKPERGFISKEFNGIYYSSKENQWLDGMVKKIQRIENTAFKMACWYCLFQACLKKRPFNMFHRANYYLRKANVSRTFGNDVTWNTSFAKHMMTAYKELERYKISRSRNLQQAKIIPLRKMNNKAVDADLVYLDPPYFGSNHSDDYFKRYHFLEGLTNYECWSDLIDTGSKIKQINTPEYLKSWHDKRAMKELLYSEIEKYRTKIVVLSYQANGYPDVDSIYDFFGDLFPITHICRKSFKHALCKTEKTEVVIIGEPK